MDLTTARHALVTGGASGIGLALARAFVARGIATTIVDANRDALDAVLAEAPERMRGALLDVRDRPGWDLVKAEAEADFGPVDILVNNAGIAPDGWEIAEMAPESFDLLLSINLTGVFNGIRAFAADMRARGAGHIVNTASMAGITVPFPGTGAYVASKFAIVGLSETLRIELAQHGVGVTVLCPGMIATNLMTNTEQMGGTLRLNRPLGDAGVSADDVAGLVLDGIARDAPFVVTHADDWWPLVAGREASLRAAFGRGDAG